MFQERGERVIVPDDFGADPFDLKCRQIGHQLGHHRRPDILAGVCRIDAERVDNGFRVGAAEFAIVDARHDEAGRTAVDLRHQRHPHPGLVQGLGELVLVIGAPVAAGDMAVDGDQGI